MQYLIVIVFAVVFATWGTELGYMRGSPLYTHFTYMFQHANVVSLVINSAIFIGLFRLLRRFMDKWIVLAGSIGIAFIVSFFAQRSVITLGSGGLLYAMAGMYYGLTVFSKKVIVSNKNHYIQSILLVLALLVISYLKTSSNLPLHLFTLTGGFVLSGTLALFTNRKYNYCH